MRGSNSIVQKLVAEQTNRIVTIDAGARCPSNQLFQRVGQSNWPIRHANQPILKFRSSQPTNLSAWLVGLVANPSNFVSIVIGRHRAASPGFIGASRNYVI